MLQGSHDYNTLLCGATEFSCVYIIYITFELTTLLSVKIMDEQRHGWAMDDHNNTDPIQSQFSLSIAAVPNSSLFLLVVSYIVSLIADGISVFA